VKPKLIKIHGDETSVGSKISSKKKC